ncbi:hypothetical protein J2125_002049 [Erwinia toletana]|uniref:Uncharacterized protein n=1 Tax=Winslowiella toletana TaxID=92490 RepID=A0ABS4P880_9GAMM|nr:hypothetical protein [Winslowiella toletana]MBP2168857.1 hypothetical protein [Winslowiella toletana]
MNTYRMPALTPDEVRRIAKYAIESVAAEKIVTSKIIRDFTPVGTKEQLAEYEAMLARGREYLNAALIEVRHMTEEQILSTNPLYGMAGRRGHHQSSR